MGRGDPDDGAVREFVYRRPRVPGLFALYGYAADGLREGLHRGIPARGLTFILSLDDPIEEADDRAAWDAGATGRFDTLVAGLHTRPTYVRQPPRQRGIQISMHPLAARSLLGASAGDLHGRTWRADDVLGTGITRLRERLHVLPSWAERFDAVEDYLRGRSAASPGRHRPRSEVVEAWARLDTSNGAATMSALARECCLSERQVSVVVRRELGLSPRSLAGLMRFDFAFAQLTSSVRSGRAPLLSDVAAHAGYYDQAHMTRAFHRYTDTAPGSFIDEEIGNIQAGGHGRGQ